MVRTEDLPRTSLKSAPPVRLSIATSSPNLQRRRAAAGFVSLRRPSYESSWTERHPKYATLVLSSLPSRCRPLRPARLHGCRPRHPLAAMDEQDTETGEHRFLDRINSDHVTSARVD